MDQPGKPIQHHLEVAALILFLLPFANGFYNPLLLNHATLFWFLDVLTYVLIPACVAFVLFTRSGLRLSHIGIERPQDKEGWLRLISHSLLLAVVFHIAYAGAASFFAAQYGTQPLFRYEWMTPKSGLGRELVAIYQGLTAGILEEFYYRGLLVALFSRYKMGQPIMVWIISCLFSLIHWEGGVAALLINFFISLFLTAYYVRFKLLIPLIVAHLLYDWYYFSWAG
jgi:hypothetical protein